MKKALLIATTATTLFIVGTAKSHAQCYGGGYYGGSSSYGNQYGAWGNGQGATLNGIAAIVAAAAPVLASSRAVAVPPPAAVPVPVPVYAPAGGDFYVQPCQYGSGWNGAPAPVVPTYRAGYGVVPY